MQFISCINITLSKCLFFNDAAHFSIFVDAKVILINVTIVKGNMISNKGAVFVPRETR